MTEISLEKAPSLKHRNTVIPAAYLILEKEGKFLLIRRFNTGYQDGNYSLIAGHVEGGETFTQAIIREAREEAAIELKPSNLRVVHVMQRPNRVDVFFKAAAWGGVIKNLEPHKCDDFKWTPINKLPANTIPYIRFVLEGIHKDLSYSEFDW